MTNCAQCFENVTKAHRKSAELIDSQKCVILARRPSESYTRCFCSLIKITESRPAYFGGFRGSGLRVERSEAEGSVYFGGFRGILCLLGMCVVRRWRDMAEKEGRLDVGGDTWAERRSRETWDGERE